MGALTLLLQHPEDLMPLLKVKKMADTAKKLPKEPNLAFCYGAHTLRFALPNLHFSRLCVRAALQSPYRRPFRLSTRPRGRKPREPNERPSLRGTAAPVC